MKGMTIGALAAASGIKVTTIRFYERTGLMRVHNLAAAHLKKLRQKITALMKLEAALARAVERCSGKPIPPCPVLELLKSVS